MTRELEYQTLGSAVVIGLPDQADAATARAVGTRIRDALGAGHRWIAVDLSAVHHMSTQTLSELCVGLRQFDAAGRRLAVVGADLRVQWVLGLCEISGLELHRTIETALPAREASQPPATEATVSPQRPL
jgi:anti-anti-sigma regulatory factor